MLVFVFKSPSLRVSELWALLGALVTSKTIKKWTKRAENDQKWSQNAPAMAPNGTQCQIMAPNGPTSLYLVLDAHIWGSIGHEWSKMVENSPIWFNGRIWSDTAKYHQI